jgi:hypothetical protein
MAENYDLIFGQSASSQYAWSDSDYQNGWQTVGSTPPTAEQFDALQRRSDTKAQELNSRLTPIEAKSEADGRQMSTAYALGDEVTADGLHNGWLLECVVEGTSGSSAITIPATLIDGATIADGTVTWKLRKVATEGGLGYRQPNTTYEAGQIAYHASLPTGYYLECTTPGTTGSGDLSISSTTIGDTVTDGIVTWTINCNLPLIGGGALTGDNLTWNGADLGGASIVAQSLGENGYVKYSNGLIVQWGFYSITANTESRTVPFPISFPSVCRAVMLTDMKLNSNSRLGHMFVTNPTISSFVANTQTSGTTGQYYYWVAIGY